MPDLRQSIVFASLALAPAALLAHGDDDIRFVAPHGTDAQGCDAPTAPCRSIGYAGGQGGKGGVVRVAGGVYELETQDDLFYLTPESGADVTGGYSDDFETRDPAANLSVLVGVPVELREALEARGFQVITDMKWYGTGQGSDPLLLEKNLAPMLQSHSAADCAGGTAAGFSCEAVDLLSHVALADLATSPDRANDVWGFVDLNTEREYALVGVQNGVAVLDVTDPTAPVEVGRVPGASTGWRDIKLVQRFDAGAGRWHAYAYVTADAAHDQLTVIDLGGLPNRIALAGRTTDAQSAHNINVGGIDPTLAVPLAGREPVLFVAGANLGGGAFRAYRIADPEAPQLVASATGGYMHDGTTFTADDGTELLADFNEREVKLWDVTDAAAPQLVTQALYPNASYTHSGSWSEDGDYLFVQDEFDERDLGVNSSMYVLDVSDRSSPQLVGHWTGPTEAIDHNGYPRGNRYYISNYARGLTVLDLTDPENPADLGYFDTFTVSDQVSFSGAWGVYPYLPSRAVLVSDIQGGLFVLADRTRDVPQGSLAFDGKVFAGERGTTLAVPVARIGGDLGAVSVGWEVIPGTGPHAGIPIARGRLDWPDGDATFRHAELELPAGTDPMQRFFVRLYDPEGGATLGDIVYASVFVEPAGADATLAFLDEPVVAADHTHALVTVVRGGKASGAVSVDYAAPGGATGTLDWPDGDATARTIALPLDVDAGITEEVTFDVTLANAQGATLADDTTTVTVVPVEPEDDVDDVPIGPPPPPPPPPPPGGGGAFGWLALVALVSAAWRRASARRSRRARPDTA